MSSAHSGTNKELESQYLSPGIRYTYLTEFENEYSLELNCNLQIPADKTSYESTEVVAGAWLKAFPDQRGNQKLYLVCAFGSGMTVSGSLTRSVLNYRSSAKTALSSIFSGCLLIAGLFLLGGLIQYIPRAALAALVITVGISLINPETIRLVLKTTKSDACVFFATFIGGLILPLDTAIYLGAAASMVFSFTKRHAPSSKKFPSQTKGNLSNRKSATTGLKSRLFTSKAIYSLLRAIYFLSRSAVSPNIRLKRQSSYA